MPVRDNTSTQTLSDEAQLIMNHIDHKLGEVLKNLKSELLIYLNSLIVAE